MAFPKTSEPVKVQIWVFLQCLKNPKRHVVHMSCNHDGNLNGGIRTVTRFHHVLVEYDDGFGHIFCVADIGQF